MESYATIKQKRNVVQISVFVLPKEKTLIEELASKDGRSVSNFCKRRILKLEASTHDRTTKS